MEGMWIYLRYAAYYMPQTYAVEALRHVFLRGNFKLKNFNFKIQLIQFELNLNF